jgi:hypothetical protein
MNFNLTQSYELRLQMSSLLAELSSTEFSTIAPNPKSRPRSQGYSGMNAPDKFPD